MNDINPAFFTVDHFNAYSLHLGAPYSAGASGAIGDPLILPIGMGALPVYQGPRNDPQQSSKDGFDEYDPAALFDGFKGLTASADESDYRFLRFRPPPGEPGRAGTATLPHIRLDRALQFLLGDRLA
jgi:hypothetical protein